MKAIMIILALFAGQLFAKPVNINTANAKTISQSLPGIGMKKAEAIIQYRNKYGPFKTLSDLVKVRGIGEKTVQKNKQDILFSEVSNLAKKAAKSK